MRLFSMRLSAASSIRLLRLFAATFTEVCGFAESARAGDENAFADFAAGLYLPLRRADISSDKLPAAEMSTPEKREATAAEIKSEHSKSRSKKSESGSIFASRTAEKQSSILWAKFTSHSIPAILAAPLRLWLARRSESTVGASRGLRSIFRSPSLISAERVVASSIKTSKSGSVGDTAEAFFAGADFFSCSFF